MGSILGGIPEVAPAHDKQNKGYAGRDEWTKEECDNADARVCQDLQDVCAVVVELVFPIERRFGNVGECVSALDLVSA